MAAEVTPGEAGQHGAVEEMIGRLGLAMLAAGYAVTDVGSTLRRVAQVSGRASMSVGALPNAILLDDPTVQRARVADMAAGTSLRFDQTQLVGTIASEAAQGLAGPTQVLEGLDEVAALPPRYPGWLMVLGNGVMAAGLSAVFRTSWAAVAVDLMVGLLVGVILLVTARLPQLAGVLPFVLGFVAAVLVFGAGMMLHLGPVPLYAVFAPIVVLVPGATITNSVIELAAGDVVSGGGRLVSGLVTWLMLLLGILLGAGVVGITPGELLTTPTADLPAWAPWLGLLVMSVGITVTNSASPQLGVVVAVVLLATFTIVVVVGAFATTVVASGVAAAVMLVIARLVESRFRNLPTIVTFRPAFWLLVPGSMGLATLSELAGARTSAAETLIVTVFGTVVAISLGVQIGAVVSEAVVPHPTVTAQYGAPD
ncbi:MAG: ThrE protein [Actinomycetota bacterium]|nr:ThrE protein [Actinomycetota bacterium]